VSEVSSERVGMMTDEFDGDAFDVRLADVAHSRRADPGARYILSSSGESRVVLKRPAA
jgi:hypothetical protein